MSIACWNIRVGARKNAMEETRDFCLSQSVKILMLFEVKSQSPPSQAIIKRCGFHDFDVIPPIGFSGGLWLLWKKCNIYPFELTILLKGARFISCLIHLSAFN